MKLIDKSIFPFTLSYPYNSKEEYTFLHEEVLYLNKNFTQLEIYPSIIIGEKYKNTKNLRINKSLASHLESNFKRRLLLLFTFNFLKLLYGELYTKPEILLNVEKTKKLIKYILNSLHVKKWAEKKFIKEIGCKKENNLIIYTYWFTYITTGLCIALKKYNHIKLITRAHGIDLFEFRNNNYIPLRKFTINLLDRLLFVSDAGKNYIENLYPSYKEKYKTFSIGTMPLNFINKSSKDGIIRIVSCSTINKIKRVELILKGLIFYAKKNPGKKIIWTHFGTGPLLGEIEILKNFISNKSNLKIDLKGFKQNDEIINFYKSEPIDIFITASSTEGGRPLSIQEAQSAGIPVIATKVGGIPEIVNNTNGYLLKEDPTNEDICTAITEILSDKILYEEKRKLNLICWKSNCNIFIKNLELSEELSNL